MTRLPQPVIAPSDARAMNEIVREFPVESRTRLLSDAAPLTMRKNQVLVDDASDPSWTYLPCSGLVSLQALTESGSSIEVAMVGREGLIGFALGTLGSGPTYRAVVSIPGQTLRVRTDALLSEFDRVAGTRHVLLTRWPLFLAEIAQSSVCHRFHPARQRLARWLLTAVDRTGLSRLHLTQDELAVRLGLQRTCVSIASLALQDLGLIRARRGRIAVLDRPRLVAAACECYRLQPPGDGVAGHP